MSVSVVVAGVYIPRSRCGAQFIIVHIDNTDKFEETLEYNNLLAVSVYIQCDMGKTTCQLIL